MGEGVHLGRVALFGELAQQVLLGLALAVAGRRFLSLAGRELDILDNRTYRVCRSLLAFRAFGNE